MTGFNYSPPRPIQYGNMNPLQGLSGSVAQGIQLGSMMDSKKTNIGLQDPDNVDIDVNQTLQDVTQDLNTYKEYYKKANKAVDENTRQQIISNVKFQTPIVAQMAENGIDPKTAEEALNKMKRNDPNAYADLSVIADRMGGWGSPGGKAIKEKAAQMKSSYDQQRAGMLWPTVKSIDDLWENYDKLASKGIKVDSETMNVVNKRNKYLRELAQIDPDGFKKYMADFESKKGRQGGGANQTGKRDSWFKTLQSMAEKLDFVKDPYAEKLREAATNVTKHAGAMRESEMRDMYEVLNEGQQRLDQKNKGGRGGSRNYTDAQKRKMFYEELRKANGDKELAKQALIERLSR